MKYTTFKEWLKLQETATGTGCVAVFARPIFSEPIRRGWPQERKKKKTAEKTKNA